MIKASIFHLSFLIAIINAPILADEGNTALFKGSSNNSEAGSLLRSLDKKRRLELIITFLTCALQRSGQ